MSVAERALRPEQFAIWWAELPDPVGRRPVMVLVRTSALPYLGRVLVAEITTTIRGIPQEVLLGAREGLRRPCVANLDNLRAIPRSVLRAPAGRLAARRHVEVKRALGHVLQWPELTGM